MKESQRSRHSQLLLGLLVSVAVVLGLAIAYRLLWRKGTHPLVVYCAHDSVYAEGILQEFSRRTGISLATKFDTEATKSLGLVELLKRESSQPRCDVFWNNELLGTLDLQDGGLLLPYRGPGFGRIPAQFRDPQGCWVGFAARLRVYIINTDKLKPDDGALQEALAGDLSRAAIAKPLYGTTLTHYSILWDLWGEETLKGWHRQCRERGLREVMGNAQVKNLVAEGVCDLGFTDSDDFFQAKDEGKPVASLPVRLPNGSTICIPNTVCIMKGTHRLKESQELVDYLLSEECELALANSSSRQIPLGPVPEGRLSAEVKTLREWSKASIPLSFLGPARAACLAWLKEEYLK
jgi:iron(III) transport system substrate-binding protein